MRSWILPAFLVTGLVAVPAHAIDVPVVGRKLIVVDKWAGHVRARVSFIAADVAVTKGSGTDTMQVEAQLDVMAGGYIGSFVMPRGSGWVENDDAGATFKNLEAPGGGTSVRMAAIKSGRFARVAARGLGESLPLMLPGSPGSTAFVALTVRNGSEEYRHCSRFDACVDAVVDAGFGVNRGRRLICRGGSVPDTACTAARPFCATPLLVDLGATVADTCAGLEWEKKVAGGPDPLNPHAFLNRYVWAGGCTVFAFDCQPSTAAAATCATATGGASECNECPPGGGTCDTGSLLTVWEWLNQVNAEGFAGHSDWRLPTTGGNADLFLTGQPPEIESLLDGGYGLCAGLSGDCIDPAFGLSTGPSWTGSPFGISFGQAWRVDARPRYFEPSIVRQSWFVRAVRSLP